MATCSLIGAAVGFAAAVAKAKKAAPHGVFLEHLAELQDLLLENDYFLPGKSREVSALCKSASLLGADDCVRNGVDRNCGAFASPVSLVKNGAAVEYRFDRTTVKSVHIVFDSDLTRATQIGHWCERTHATRANTLKNSPDQKLPTTLAKEYVLSVKNGGEEQVISHVTENSLRAITLPVGKEIDGIKLTVLSNYDGGDFTPIISFDFK